MVKTWITGAKGFLGSRLSKFLKERDNIVYGIGHVKKEEVGLLIEEKDHLNGDICQSNLQKLLDLSGPPEVIYHLGGGSSVGASISNPYLDYEKTVSSTLNILEFFRIKNLKAKIIFVSSAAVYGNAYERPIKENDLCKPFSPYGFNKYIAEKLFESYVENYNFKVCIIRFFSIYGVNSKKQLIWDICRKLTVNNNFIELFGTGNEIRDWMYIDDAIDLLDKTSNYMNNLSDKFLILNGSSEQHFSVKDIVEKVCSAMNLSPNKNFNHIKRSGDPMSLIGSNNKIKSLLEFKPKFDINKGIKEYVEWFKLNNL